MATVDERTVRALVHELGVPGAIRYARQVAHGNGPLAGEYSAILDWLETYYAAVRAIR